MTDKLYKGVQNWYQEIVFKKNLIYFSRKIELISTYKVSEQHRQ